MTDGNKPVILTFIGNYLPGYKAGGILRVIANTVDHLYDEIEFRIVTRDRDVGDEAPYANIKINQWQKVGNAMVYYLSPQACTLKYLEYLIINTPHDLLYLNSFFESLTIKVLLSRKFHRVAFKPVIVAPWGEFGWASLKQKYIKKFIFIQGARLIGLYGNVIWRASSEFEKLDIMKHMKIKTDAIHIVGDLPIKNIPDIGPIPENAGTKNQDFFKIIFLSRISREKNLDFALEVLKKVKVKVVFDIYGPEENKNYWKECQDLINKMPPHIKVNYFGEVDAHLVLDIFSRYDLFFFPTGGEAYGHVIAECLTSGTPVLISTETPWRNLQADGLGWDIDLSKMDTFVDIIEQVSLLNPGERLKRRNVVKEKIMERLSDPLILEANRQLFGGQLI